MRTPFFGVFGVSRSKNLSDNQLINLFPEIVETKSGKEIGAFYMTPGLKLLTTVGDGPIRGAQSMGGNLYVVSADQVFVVTPGYVVTMIGSIPTSSSGPVSIINNGNTGQMAIFDGMAGYLAKGSTLTPITLPFNNPTIASYQDTFGLVVSAGTQSVFGCNSLDLSVWQPLSFGSADALNDNVVALVELHDETWILKNNSCEVWVNAGLSPFAFQRLAGVVPEMGCVAPYSAKKVGEGLIWLSQNGQGQGQVMQGLGYGANRISTNGMETEIATYSVISDAIAYSYQQEGHTFYNLTFPTAGQTWSYDATVAMETKLPAWHKRAAWSNGLFVRERPNCHAFWNGLTVVGDYVNGNLYALDLNTLTDNGAQRKWLRSWRALPQASEQPVRFSTLRIDMETGIGVPSATNPLCMLRWSDDGGHTWSNYLDAAVGPTGKTAQRVMFRRLGSTRRDSGLDRIFELSSSDQFKVTLIGAELNG